MRFGRLTASMLHKFDKKVLPVSDLFVRAMLWDPSPDLSNSPAIEHGKKHEKDALMAAVEVIGGFDNCGLFVSHVYPWLAGSPGIFLPRK